MSLLDPILDFFRGKAVTIPPMDGALRPNTLLDDSEVVVAALEPDNLAILNGKLIYSSGHEVRQVSPKKILESFASAVTALAVGDGGALAIGLEDGSLLLNGKPIDGFNCITALTFHQGTLYVCNGSADFAPSQWASDLMHRNKSGSVWRVDPATGSRTQLVGGLGYAYGLAIDAKAGRLVVSESWAHRLAAIPLSGGKPVSVLPRLPAYPARIAATETGYLLSLFAPLNRLVEFVLQEPEYRSDMMREVDSRHWIAPTLSPAHSFLEPLQNGGVRSMGVHKPWSPTRSYGLVAELDHDFQPQASYHSRANGRFHGVTSAIAWDGKILAASKGGNHILRLDAGGGA